MSITITQPGNENLEQVLKNGATGTDPIVLTVNNLLTGFTVTYDGTPLRQCIYSPNGVILANENLGANCNFIANELHMYTIAGIDPVQFAKYGINSIQYYYSEGGVDTQKNIFIGDWDLGGGTNIDLRLPNISGTLATMETQYNGDIDTTTNNFTLSVPRNLSYETVAIGTFFVNLDNANFTDGMTCYICKRTSGNLKFQALTGALYGNSTVSSNGLIIITRLGSNFYINQP